MTILISPNYERKSIETQRVGRRESVSGCLPGDTLLLDYLGELHKVEDLAAEYEQVVRVPCLDRRGNFTSTIVHDFRASRGEKEFYRISTSNGQTLQVTASCKLLLEDNTWITADELGFGDLLKSAIYNPRLPHPNLQFNEVESVVKTTLPEPQTVYNFMTIGSDNLFVAQKLNKNKISLLCLADDLVES